MSEFPKVLAAARQVEKSQWALGDALIEECANGRTILQAHQYLVNNGLCRTQFSVYYLQKVKEVAHNFKKSSRHDDVSWSAHQEAGKPETLDKITQALAGTGKKPTVDAVRAFLDRAPTRYPPLERRPSPPPITAPENEVRTIISQMLNWRDKWGEARFYDAQAAHLRDLWVEAMNTARLIMNDFDPAFKPAVIDGGKSVA